MARFAVLLKHGSPSQRCSCYWCLNKFDLPSRSFDGQKLTTDCASVKARLSRSYPGCLAQSAQPRWESTESRGRPLEFGCSARATFAVFTKIPEVINLGIPPARTRQKCCHPSFTSRKPDLDGLKLARSSWCCYYFPVPAKRIRPACSKTGRRVAALRPPEQRLAYKDICAGHPLDLTGYLVGRREKRLICRWRLVQLGGRDAHNARARRLHDSSAVDLASRSRPQ